MSSDIVVVGGGFAGTWAALSAARQLDVSGMRGAINVTLVSADEWLTIRPRLYEDRLLDLRVPLDPLLRTVGVERVEAFATDVDTGNHTLTVAVNGRKRLLHYERLVLAAGSQVRRPSDPGIADAFSVDTFAEAQRLADHLGSPPGRSGDADPFQAVVVGAGFTGVEVATELAARLRRLARRGGRPGTERVTIVDSATAVAPAFGPDARAVVDDALERLGIHVRLGQAVAGVSPAGVTLQSGAVIPAGTTVWTGGLRANPLTATLGVETDPLGRLPVDDALRVIGVDDVFAAGDVARAMADEGRAAPMSCQHAIPMGKFAGHNAAAGLVGGATAAYRQPDYVTCLDLGDAGALFTRGWDRTLIFTGAQAKRLKEQINRRDIYPPSYRDRARLLEAARPISPSMEGLVHLGAR